MNGYRRAVSMAVAGMLALVLATPAGAQSDSYPPTTSDPLPTAGGPSVVVAQGTPRSSITVNARIVVLDVVVTDKQGRVVQRELKRDDFKVLEDGVPQRIRSFEPPREHDLPVTASGQPVVVHSAADLSRIGQAPVTLLVIDELNTTFQDASYSRQMLEKYLKSQPAVLKQPTALMVATNTSFQQLHDYTQDRDALLHTVHQHMPQVPWKMENSGNKGAGAVERMVQVLAALQQVAQASQGTPGRKNVIWVGNGFPSANLVGLPTDEGDVIESAIRRCTDRLLAARVTMYTINPTADSTVTVEADDPDDLDQTGTDAGPDPFGEGAVSFSALAPATGGVAFMGRNDLNDVIGESIDRGQVYYTLSYAPTNKTDVATKFRKIRVVMTDPQLRATTREGYYPETEGDLNPTVDKTMAAKQVAANLRLDLSAALTSTMAYNGLQVTETQQPGDVFQLHVAEPGIAWSEPDAKGQQHTEATVAAAWYDARGRILGHTAREEVSVRGTGAAGANFQLPVPISGAPVRLRFVVRDALNGHMGTVDVTKF